jgi:hypothetical protein
MLNSSSSLQHSWKWLFQDHVLSHSKAFAKVGPIFFGFL